MKTAFLLAATALVCSASTVLGAQCATADITGIATLPEFQKLASACGTSNFAAATSADAATSAFCKGDCIKAVEALSKAMPKCESSGVSLSASYDVVLKNCKAGSASTPAAAPAGAATPAPTTSSGVAINGANAAVGAVAVALALARA